MKKKGIFLILTSFFLHAASAQVCTVKQASLKGKYFGDCKNGWAHGYGTATGKDTYTGEFKKGLPDGRGKYVFENGDWYDGEWKAGFYDGQGTLSTKDKAHPDSIIIQEGFWKKGKYLGKQLPYYLAASSADISSVKFTRLDTTGNEITIITETVQGGAASLGYTTKSTLISIDNLEGIYTQKTNYGSSNKTENKYGLTGVQFPYKAILSFETKGPLMKHVDTMTFGLNEKGSWVIRVTISN